MRVIIVGAGFGGIGAAIELRGHGFEDITILEAASELGGTWFHNTYPGAACDVPSFFYSYSYAQRTSWSRKCSPQTEILDYLRDVAQRFDVTRHIVTGAKVESCEWSDEHAEWTVTTSDGTERIADAVILGTGQLNQPAYPAVVNRESFAGHSFHSARWDDEYDLAGKRVAVVGTGASAVQFVPKIAEKASQLTVFQRTGNWFLPRTNEPNAAWARWLHDRFPIIGKLRRLWLFYYTESVTLLIRHPRTFGRLGKACSSAFMRKQVPDPVLRRKVWPDYTFGCKRILFSSAFLPALGRANVDLVDEPIAEMTPAGPRTKSGQIHEVDCVIYGTGFRTNDFMFPMRITGVEGKDLSLTWADGAHAYLGMTIPGYPSLFVLYGPNTNTSGGSIIHYLETQCRYIRQALRAVRQRGVAAIEVRADVEQQADQRVQSRFQGTAWTGCDSWYRNDSGRIVANWPDFMRDYDKAAKRLDVEEFTFVEKPKNAAGRTNASN